MNYLQRKKLAFMSIVNQIKGFVRTITGVPPLVLPDCVGGTNLINYSISGNSVQDGTPTPDSPVDIESVGEKTKNLFDVNAFVNLEGNSTYYGLNDDGELIQISADYRGNDSLPTAMILSAGTYSASNMGTNFRIYNKTSKSIVYSNTSVGHTFTLDETSEITLKWWNSADVVIGKPMLQKGTVATEYEPYGYKIPIAVRGKNLLNISGRTLGTLTGTAATTVRNLEFDKYYVGLSRNNIYAPSYVLSYAITGDVVTVEAKLAYYGVAFPIKAKPNTTYRISALNDSVIGIGFYTKDGEFIKDGLTYKIITTPENCEIMTIVCAPTVTNTATIYEELQVEEGEIATDYEPYQEPTETSIYLNEPLRKAGDVADYIDFENSKVVRNVCERKIVEIQTDSSGNSRAKFDDGVVSTSFVTYGSTTQRERYGITLGFITSDSKKMGTIEPQTKKGLCTALQVSNSLVATYPHIVFGWQSNVIYILNFSDTAESKAELNNELAGIVNNTDFRIVYLLATPTEELIKLPNIPLNKGTTILSVGTIVQPSNMSATYYSTSKE